MSVFADEPTEIHVDVPFPNGALIPINSFIRVVLSNDGLNPGYTVDAYLNGTPIHADVLEDEDD